jgi:2-polyprenyl-3-methyl-5-hydroxy-6-metoxy-1,4-benzoquinol methylase
VEAQAQAISRDRNSLAANPPLQSVLPGAKRVLDVGCGAGWLTNLIRRSHDCAVTGIDFNPVAIERARAVADHLGLDTEFKVQDLFTFVPEQRFDVIISLGVLHHTNDCVAAIRHLVASCLEPGGHLYVGLYHSYGREPFLSYFRKLREGGATEDDLFARYRELHSYLKDETHLRSWFRDQVLHPHETQHSMEEMAAVLAESQMKLLSTSINRFQPITDLAELVRQEREYRKRGEEALAQRRYFPGFFTFLARRIGNPG